jgi:DNA adenine methylase
MDPFLKWAGGKRQLLSAILPRIPEKIGGVYYEPFIGAGALFFALASLKRIRHAKLSDTNEELIGTFKAVRDEVENVIEALGEHRNELTYYYKIRAIEPSSLNAVERAARMIFLNRCGYNGLYRVNSSGAFNVPFGKNKWIPMFLSDTLRASSQALQIAELEVQDFERALENMHGDDFVYCDPPYIPLSASSSFTSYTRTGFKYDDQVRLRDFALALKNRNIQILLSNSSAPLARELYGSGFRTKEVKAKRALNCQAEKRGAIKELLIW